MKFRAFWARSLASVPVETVIGPVKVLDMLPNTVSAVVVRFVAPTTVNTADWVRETAFRVRVPVAEPPTLRLLLSRRLTFEPVKPTAPTKSLAGFVRLITAPLSVDDPPITTAAVWLISPGVLRSRLPPTVLPFSVTALALV